MIISRSQHVHHTNSLVVPLLVYNFFGIFSFLLHRSHFCIIFYIVLFIVTLRAL